jgi:hypothetical protein
MGKSTSPKTASPMLHHTFLEMAEQFFDAYLILKQTRFRPIDWAAYFNFCHAIEVALKAFLICKGMTSAQLSRRDYGHDLEKLMGECEIKGMSFTDRQKLCIVSLGKVHSNYWSRYPKEDWSDGGVPTVGQFETEAVDILNSISIQLRGGPAMIIVPTLSGRR